MRDHDPSKCDCLVLAVDGAGEVTEATVKPAHMIVFPRARSSFDDDGDTGPMGFTIVGPFIEPREPAGGS